LVKYFEVNQELFIKVNTMIMLITPKNKLF